LNTAITENMVVARIWRIEGLAKEELMADTRRRARDDSVDRIIDSLGGAENSAFEAVRKFLDTVNDAFPHLGEGGGTRQKIIDSAFRMTEELVGTSNQLAQRLVKVGGATAKRAPARKAAARKTTARKTTTKRAPARKAAARKTAARKTTAKRAPARKAAAR
jgi:hypothetical protein